MIWLRASLEGLTSPFTLELGETLSYENSIGVVLSHAQADKSVY